MTEERKYSLTELKEVAAALGVGQKHDTSSATPSYIPTHGPIPGSTTQYGIFSGAGVRPGMWNATPRVRSFASIIPMFKSVYANEMLQVATGVTPPGAITNQTSACVVGPKPGQLLAMKIAASFGIIHASTKIFDITQMGLRRNRADIDREMYNVAQIQNAWLPQVPGIDGGRSLDAAMRSEFYALGINLERDVSAVHFTGVSGTESNAYFGVARQWNGLDRLIRAGWTDVDTGLAVPAADATVVAFNAAIDGGTDVYVRTIVGALIDTYYAQQDYMRRIGITAQYALVMRPDMFRALAQVWSCSYSTTRCTSSSAGTPLVRDAVSIRSEYEAMLNGMYLPMEGENVPVILDDSIARDTLGNGYFKSDIYGVALTGNGRPVVYGEYFPMDNPEAMEVVNYVPDGTTQTANNGMYRVFKRVTGGCVEYDFFARPRLITDAPFMHFRIDDLFYKSAYNQRDAVPGMSYYPTGGASYAS